MGELIYSVENIFARKVDSCLIDYDADRYHIAAYQRGYKWGSDENGAVTVLLNDLWSAFEKGALTNKSAEYYLQYITLKKSAVGMLEVIDGQQRLTTLSILISICSLKLDLENIACDRLEYAIRASFFDKHIYQRNLLKELLSYEWDRDSGLVIGDTHYDNQDIFYLFTACKKINSFLDSETVMPKIAAFYAFVLQCVKIIVNVIDHVASEKVFSNLNSNKVPLTESELIKGLFITMYARLEENGKRKNFREISEQRILLGRKWDEIEGWVRRAEVRTFYFDEEDPMEGFLALVANAISPGFKRKTGNYDHKLFNFYHGQDIAKVHNRITEVYNILKDWFDNPVVYNRLGYLFFHKGSSKNVFDYSTLIDSNKDKLEHVLLGDVLDLIPEKVDELYYENGQDKDIHKVLLAINIFSSAHKFNFQKSIDEKWTLEHIFPQTPEGKKNELRDSDKEYILDMVDEVDRKNVTKILAKKSRNPDEKQQYQDAMKRSGLINSIGNLCLLSNVDNILNGCAFYHDKRTKVLGRIQKGSFVPIHTYEVFSKLIFKTNTGDFERWTADNIKTHKHIIEEKIENVRVLLRKEKVIYESR